MNTIHPRDAYAIESWLSKYAVTNSNYVDFDKTVNEVIIWMITSYLLTFTQCYFFETNGITFSYKGHSCEMKLCYSDYENNDMFTYNEKIITYELHIEQTCNLIFNRSCENKISKRISIIYVFIGFCILNS